jgi:hypothetical protein
MTFEERATRAIDALARTYGIELRWRDGTHPRCYIGLRFAIAHHPRTPAAAVVALHELAHCVSWPEAYRTGPRGERRWFEDEGKKWITEKLCWEWALARYEEAGLDGVGFAAFAAFAAGRRLHTYLDGEVARADAERLIPAELLIYPEFLAA